MGVKTSGKNNKKWIFNVAQIITVTMSKFLILGFKKHVFLILFNLNHYIPSFKSETYKVVNGIKLGFL